RMNSAVLDELGQGEPGNLPAHVIEGADDDHAWRIVHDHIHTGGLLESPDVAAFATDNPAFHVIAGNVHGADSRVGSVTGRVPLKGGSEDFAGTFLGFLAQCLLVLLDAHSD